METKLADALARVTKYLDERAKMPRIEQEEISSFHIGDEREAILKVSDLRAIIAAHTDDGWISAADRLPESEQNVWASWIGAGNWSHDAKQGLARHVDGLGWQPLQSMGWDWSVTHWMPLPELPAAAGAA